MKTLHYILISFISLFMNLFAQSLAQENKSISINWTVAGSIAGSNEQTVALGVAGPIAGVHNNVLLIGGGCNFPGTMPWRGGIKQYYNDLYIYTKDKTGNLDLVFLTKLPYPVGYAASCATAKGVVLAGGENGTGMLDKALLLQWNRSKQNIEIRNLPNLPFPVTNASLAASGNTVYLAGGETALSTTDQFLTLDLNDITAGWKVLSPIPHPVSHSVLAVQPGGESSAVYLIGGRKKNSNGISDLYASVYAYNPSENQWKQKQDLPYPLSAGAGMASGTEKILLFGGDIGETFHKTEELIAAINQEKDTTKKERLNQKKIQIQSSHPGFSNQVLQYSTVTGQWLKLQSVPFTMPVTTVACRWGNDVIIPSGEIKAGVRTPQILLGKICNRR